MLRDNLKDILKHTYSLGFIDFVKVEGDSVKSVAEDKSVVIRGTMINPLPELEGKKIGMSNMSVLKGLLDFPPFQEEDADIFFVNSKTKDGEDYPRNIVFTSEYNHKSQYILMSAAQADARVKVPKKIDIKNDIEVVPSNKNIKDMQYFTGFMGSANKLFKVTLNKGTLEFHLGDENTTQTVIPIATGVEGKLTKDMFFPIAQVLAILKLSENSLCTMGFMNNLGMNIEIKSGLCEYNYTLQARKEK